MNRTAGISIAMVATALLGLVVYVRSRSETRPAPVPAAVPGVEDEARPSFPAELAFSAAHLAPRFRESEVTLRALRTCACERGLPACAAVENLGAGQFDLVMARLACEPQRRSAIEAAQSVCGVAVPLGALCGELSALETAARSVHSASGSNSGTTPPPSTARGSSSTPPADPPYAPSEPLATTVQILGESIRARQDCMCERNPEFCPAVTAAAGTLSVGSSALHDVCGRAGPVGQFLTGCAGDATRLRVACDADTMRIQP